MKSDQTSKDFELELEYNLSAGGNSGILMRTFPGGRLNGADFHEIQLLDDTSEQYANLGDVLRTGSLYGQLAAHPVLRPEPNRWHSLSIRLVDRHLQVTINSVRVVDGLIPDGKPPSGSIGLQLHGADGSRVSFRNIRIRPINR